MTTKKHRMIAYGVAVHLLLVAIVCYAAFPVDAPEEPYRLMYTTKAGNVLFDHKTHASPEGYGMSCFDCHHRPPNDEEHEERPEDESLLISCGKCHMDNPTEGEDPAGCFECHEEATTKADAVHGQCSQCHHDYGKGPIWDGIYSQEEKNQLKTAPNAWVDCNKCHIL